MSSLIRIPFQVPFGAYPGKPESATDQFDTRVNRYVHARKQQRATSVKRRQQFLALVDQFSSQLSAEAAEAYLARLETLRYEIRKAGYCNQTLAEVFAIVREVSGVKIGMRHYPHQLAGAWAMMHGVIAEMDTGQGKSLCATLTACAAAISGVSVHVITVNEYLARRDAEQFAPLYRALGLRVSVVLDTMNEDEKRTAYRAEVVYCTNKQVAFDYLRDRLQAGAAPEGLRQQLSPLYRAREQGPASGLLLNGLSFAIIDEADSVLVDEALTPLIISSQRGRAGNDRIYATALQLADALGVNRDYRVSERERTIDLLSSGKARLQALGEKSGGLWRNCIPRDELVLQALRARHLFIRNRHYLVAEGKINIVDENTGRVMEGRAWEAGLQQLIELKEGCELTASRETAARISYQRFFQRYINLAGMTGTAKEIKPELRRIYGLEVVRIPPAQPSKRLFEPVRYTRSAREKWLQVVERVAMLHGQGQPVLLGVKSVETSAFLSGLLAEGDLPHQVLNALNDQEEAAIIARAGQPGQITVATNMAGRGTDIKIAEAALELGGLTVVATERHESRRVDRQLYGRCARQGDPGRVEAFLALDDEIVCKHGSVILGWLLSRLWDGRSLWGQLLARYHFALSQKRIEAKHEQRRKQVMESDKQTHRILAFSGRAE
ncbi:MAG: hypothetical protein MI864_10895 [Pseudomonadales bacterium]|nr:hypothetical protein [Pseudomonadales bacterium]